MTATTHINREFEERMLDFGVGVVKHCARYKQPVMKPIVNQVIRSATSVGANYIEANNASSRADFRNKISIAKKEASETRYWLRMLEKLGDRTEELQNLQSEARAFAMILQKITNSLKQKSEK